MCDNNNKGTVTWTVASSEDHQTHPRCTGMAVSRHGMAGQFREQRALGAGMAEKSRIIGARRQQSQEEQLSYKVSPAMKATALLTTGKGNLFLGCANMIFCVPKYGCNNGRVIYSSQRCFHLLFVSGPESCSVVAGYTRAACIGAVTGSTWALWRKASPLKYGAALAFNFGITTACFCAMREASAVMRGGKDDVWNVVLGGVTSGGILGGIHGGHPGAVKAAIACTAVGCSLYLGSEAIHRRRIRHALIHDPELRAIQERALAEQEGTGSMVSNMVSAAWSRMSLPKWSPVRPITPEEAAKQEAEARELNQKYQALARYHSMAAEEAARLRKEVANEPTKGAVESPSILEAENDSKNDSTRKREPE
eukprot:jgi/Mesvir1/25511/Mv01761-RA.1